MEAHYGPYPSAPPLASNSLDENGAQMQVARRGCTIGALLGALIVARSCTPGLTVLLPNRIDICGGVHQHWISVVGGCDPLVALFFVIS